VEGIAIPTILSNYVPTIAAGSLFSRFTEDDTLNIRWITGIDPVYYEVANRPIADVALRQLIIAKALDNLQVRLGHQALYPFIIQPRVTSGTFEVDVPISLIWDIHASLPKKWENLRLAKIKRISGTNSTSYTGWLRLIFTANVQNSTTEVAVFYADYHIDSNLTYQLIRLQAVQSPEESVSINSSETETVAGFLIFQTLNTSLQTTIDFYDLLAPPDDNTDADSNGFYDIPSVYELSDTAVGGTNVTDDFSTSGTSHGTGLLTDSAWCAIPLADSDIQSWVTASNFPFDATASRRSTDGIAIPVGLFREFNLTAPAGDQPSGDTSGLFYPVWISRIERVGTGTTQLRFYFATYNVTDTEAGGQPSTETVEFASMDLLRSYSEGNVIEIVPIDNLQNKSSSSEEWEQGFGRGHVVLSSVWDDTTAIVSDFFDEFASILDNPADTTFSQGNTRISSFGLSRVPKYVPTIGQSRALLGSTSRRTTEVPPSYDNRFVTELDQGLGNQVDLESKPGITPNSAVDRFGYSGSLCHKSIRLIVDGTKVGTDPTYYDTVILPRLRILLGRDPIYGDEWFNGTRFMRFSGDAWVG